VRNEDSRDEERRSSARLLLNLHIAIYSTTHGRPPPITIVLSHLSEKDTHRRGTRREPRRKFIVERTRRALVPGRVREFWTSYRLSVPVNRGERATIISRQSPRKSSQRTGTAPPLCANFSYGQKALGLATNKRSHGRYQARAYTHVSWHARTATHVHFHSYAHTRTAARRSRFEHKRRLCPQGVLEVIPYHRRTLHSVSL